MSDITWGLALLAGFVSFVSPCVLPLVPAYIGYMSGRMTQTVSSQVQMGADGTAALKPTLAMRFNTLMHGLAFVFGFTLVFVLLGVLTTAFIQQFGGQNVAQITSIIGRVGGVVIIIFGLHFMGKLQPLINRLGSMQSERNAALAVIVLTVGGAALLLWGFAGTLALWDESLWISPLDGETAETVWAPIIGIILALMLVLWVVVSHGLTHPTQFLENLTGQINSALYADTRPQMSAKTNDGLLGSMFMGVVFSAGWTPCIGPIYGAILTLSAQTGDVAQAVPLLTFYSLGLGIPFLLAALLLDSAQGVIRRLNRYMGTIKLISGAFLIFIGLAVASGQLQYLSQQLGTQFTELSIRVEECSIGWAQGEITFDQLGVCLNGEQDFDDLRQLNEAASLLKS